MQCIFVNYLKRSQSHQCLLMPVIQVNRNIPVINPRHIRIKDTGSQLCKLPVPRHPIEESGVTGYSKDFAVQTFYIPACFGWVYTLHGRSGSALLQKVTFPFSSS